MVVYMADRQKSSSKASGTTKKGFSSPSVHALPDGDHEDMSPSDKKRNKLGYHRTAVACGHCRKRKIRCIPAPDPASTRCQNCLRLKKDCQFFPVDQSPAAQSKRNRSESKVDPVVTRSETSASSSSPRMHAGVPAIDQYDHLRAPIEATNLVNGAEHEYLHTYDQRQWYTPESHQHSYWLQHDSTSTTSFPQSPYPMTPTTSTSHSMSSQEHAFTYPALSLDQPNYPYPVHRPRDGPLPPSSNVTGYGGFRANTMPERIVIPNEAQHGPELHQNALKTQQLMSPSYASLHTPTQYAPPVTNQPWMASHPESQHHSGNFANSGSNPAWFHHSDGLNNARDDNTSHLHRRDSALQEPIRFRSKPG